MMRVRRFARKDTGCHGEEQSDEATCFCESPLAKWYDNVKSHSGRELKHAA